MSWIESAKVTRISFATTKCQATNKNRKFGKDKIFRKRKRLSDIEESNESFSKHFLRKKVATLTIILIAHEPQQEHEFLILDILN